MRIMTLDEMVDELRAEARISTNLAHGVHALEPQKKLLRRIQEELYHAHDWPALKTVRTKVLQPGTRYAEYPDGIDWEGIEFAYTKDGSGCFQPLVYGIGVDELNVRDSDADERDFPVRNWQHYLSPQGEQVNQNMFEVWPVPDREATIRFAGKRALFPLVDGSHTSTLDGPLIVLNAAAEILAAQKAEDAPLKLQRARDRLELLKRRQGPSTGGKSVNFAGGGRYRPLRPGIDYIPR